MEYREEGKDAKEEETLVLQDEKHYQDVRSKIFASFQLIEDYEESFKIYEAALPDPDLARKEADEKGSKEALAKLLKQEEELQKQEAEAAVKAEDERNRRKLRHQVVKREIDFKESVVMYKRSVE